MSPSQAIRTMSLVALVLCLALIKSVALTAPMNSEISHTLETSVAQGHATLNDMFREVEKLMEDTLHKLEEAVYKMDNESARSILHLHDLPMNYQDESINVKTTGKQSVYSVKKTDTITDNRRGETHFSRTIIQSNGRANNIDYECIIDEDCGKGRYCLYERLQSRCLPCKTLNMLCTKDEECCAEQLCVWGHCSGNGTKGAAGSICQHQSDCSPALCCAFHKVCTSKPTEHERCHSHPNHLMDLLSWDMEGRGLGSTAPVPGGSSASLTEEGLCVCGFSVLPVEMRLD